MKYCFPHHLRRKAQCATTVTRYTQQQQKEPVGVKSYTPKEFYFLYDMKTFGTLGMKLTDLCLFWTLRHVISPIKTSGYKRLISLIQPERSKLPIWQNWQYILLNTQNWSVYKTTDMPITLCARERARLGRLRYAYWNYSETFEFTPWYKVSWNFAIWPLPKVSTSLLIKKLQEEWTRKTYRVNTKIVKAKEYLKKCEK